jgi:Holliday junction resolvase RusA-like endonuclease
MGAEYSVTLLVVYADRRRRDLDNVVKAVLDGCKGSVYADDSSVCELHVTRAYDKASPRVEATVRVAG